MAVKILGVDTPLNSQAEVPFENNVELPFKYGPGGFYKPGGVPSIVGPTTGAQGTSLSALSDWRNPFTSPHVDPTTGQPEMLTGQGGIVDRTAPKNPMSWLTMGANLFGNKAKIAALAAAEATRATPAETGEFNPAMITGRPDAPWDTTHGLPAPAAPPQRGMPWPDTGVAPAPVVRAGGGPRVTPAAVGPAAAAQQPNLGNYSAFTQVDRPNADVAGGARGRQSVPYTTALDLSHLFGGGQPAPAAAAPASILARPDLAQRVPLSKTALPVPRPKDKAKSKSSSTS